MKFATKNLFILGFVLFTFLISITVSSDHLVDPNPNYNQKEVFPSQYNSATNSSNLEYANFTAPLLSGSLSETDPKRKLRFIDFIKYFQFSNYRMTRGEAADLFKFADANRDDLLDTQEWDDIVGLFILPFEACDRDHDYLLDEAEFKVCFEKDPKFRTIIFNRRHQGVAHQKIMEVINHRQKNLINFNEYLFVRRALFAWKQCHSNAKYMAKSHFSCALKTALGFERKTTYKLSDDEIYNAGVRMDNDHEIQLNFICYLRILHYFHIFNAYNNGNSIAILEKTQLLKAIREDRLPNNLEESEVEIWYDLISANPLKKEVHMKFSTFALFYNWHRLFNKYSEETPLMLSQTEAISLFKDELAPIKTILSVDKAFTNFSVKEYQEASLSLNRLRPNEAQYFFSFLTTKENVEINKAKENNFLKVNNEKLKTGESELENEEAFLSSNLRELMVSSLTSSMSFENKQDASENTAAIWNKTTVNATLYPHKETHENRKVFFNMFSEGQKWSKAEYFRAFSLGNLFTFMVPDSRFVVPSTEFVDKLMTAYETSNPPTNINQRENYGIYKLLSRDISVDILTFFAIENYRHKLKAFMKSSNTNVPETLIKLLLSDFGMENMPDTVVDLGKNGQNISKERIYDPDKTMRNVIYVNSIASENSRNKFFRETLHVKHNYEPSRRYPGFPRRSQASPHV